MMSDLASRIKMLRQSVGMTQEQLGKIIDVVKSTVSLYEHGRSTPNDQIKTTLCEYFGVSMDYLLGLSDDPKGRGGSADQDQPFFFTPPQAERLKDLADSRLPSTHPGADRRMVDDALGGKETNLRSVIRMADIFDVSTDYLLCRIGPQEEKALSAFCELDEDNKDIIMGEIKRALRDQRQESKEMGSSLKMAT